MGGRFVVFGGGMERESAGPVDWMERRDTGKEFESGGGQQSLFNCAAVAAAGSGRARLTSGGGAAKSGLARALRIGALGGEDVGGVRAGWRVLAPGGQLGGGGT